MITPIDPAWKDWIQTISGIGAVIGIIIALLKYVSEQKQNREQRERQLKQSELELRWKQAGAAKDLLDDMLSDNKTLAALKMLDWNDIEYEVALGKKEVIWEKDYVNALRTSNLNFDNKETFIRDCFDNLFYYMAMLEHYVESDLVRLEDVAFPLDYYLKIINKNKVVFEKFLNHYSLIRTLKFMKRLDEFTKV